MKGILLTIGTVFAIFFGYLALGGVVSKIFAAFAPMAIMIYFPLILFAFYSWGFMGSFRFIGRIFGNNASVEDAFFINNLIAISFLLGAVTSVLGIVITMGHLSEGIESIGEHIGGSLLGFIFGAMPAIIFLPLKKGSAVNSSDMLKVVASFAFFAVVGSAGVFFMTMWLVSPSA